MMAKRGFSTDSYTKRMLVDFLSVDELHPSSHEKIQNFVKVIPGIQCEHCEVKIPQ